MIWLSAHWLQTTFLLIWLGQKIKLICLIQFGGKKICYHKSHWTHTHTQMFFGLSQILVKKKEIKVRAGPHSVSNKAAIIFPLPLIEITSQAKYLNTMKVFNLEFFRKCLKKNIFLRIQNISHRGKNHINIATSLFVVLGLFYVSSDCGRQQ